MNLNALEIIYMSPLYLGIFHNRNNPGTLTLLVQLKQTNGV